MRSFPAWCAFALALIAGPCVAQQSAWGMAYESADGTFQIHISAANPMPVTCNNCNGGGGGGAVTAVSGAYALGSIVDLGTGASPGANTLNGRIAALALQIPSALGSQVSASSLSVVLASDQANIPTVAKPSAASANGVALVSTTTAPASGCLVVKASAGNLFLAHMYLPSAGFLMVFNLTSAPADGTVTPVDWVYAPTAGSVSTTYPTFGAFMSAGATICASSTGPFTKTAITAGVSASGQAQ